MHNVFRDVSINIDKEESKNTQHKALREDLETQKTPKDDESIKSTIKKYFNLVFPNFKLISITTGLVLLCVLVYLIEWAFYVRYTWPCTLYKLGGNYLPVIQRHQHFQRLLNPILLHTNLIHLVLNMMILLILGNSTEEFFGRINYIVLILFSGFGGNLVSAALSAKCGITVGSSTVVMGILAFQLIWLMASWHKFGKHRIFYAVYLGVMFFFILLAGFFSSENAIDIWGHLGGFLTGFCITLILYREVREHQRLKRFRIPGFFGILIILGAAVALAIMRRTHFCVTKIC
ncbi:unnamed protein product [Moneuplotes crassus]|uniref:Rhomboid-like protease n=1 Tax=Euplotes crassus TaxID=5936 RepID=A0AAD1XR72_EUPCR|nr:unnamed protein product [Moneuplotes crassus]